MFDRSRERQQQLRWLCNCLMLTLGALHSGLGMAQAGAAVGAQEPPLCTDKESLKGLKKGYDFLESQGGGLKLKEITAVKELYLRPSPASVNQYANSKHYGVKSRYCEAVAQLSNGSSDPMYWRMDYLVDGAGHSINYDSCSLRHDLTDPKCRSIRDGK
ncbi:MAG: exported protein of unknown function [Ramlibacter sp.]|nr:exported protein of unknown function [Ramlibacter sp.]